MALGVDPSAYESQQVFDELLATVSSKPDARELFQHLIAAIGRIVPYDEAQLVLLTEDGSPYLYARTPDGVSEGVADKSAATNLESLEPQVLDTVPEPDRDLRCGLKVPVKVCDRIIGAFALFSRGPGRYSPSDLAVAQRAANYLALGLDYQRLAEHARDAAVERQRSAEIESSVELLRTISDVLDIRTVFPRVSEIVKKMLPHDALAMVFVDQDRHFVRQAHVA